MRDRRLCLNFSFLQVKWRGLEYEECTWEMEGDLEDCMDLVQAFLDREKYGKESKRREGGREG